MSDPANPRPPLRARVPLVGGVPRISKGSSALPRRMRALVWQQEGPNELPAQQKRNLLTIVLEVVREPMFLMLVAAGVVYLLLGRAGRRADAARLRVRGDDDHDRPSTTHGACARGAARSLEPARARDPLTANVGASRGARSCAATSWSLAEGDRVPADGLLRQALHLATDESLLTGESVPVRKVPSADARALDRPGGDDLPSVFSGTLVTSGKASSRSRPRARGRSLARSARLSSRTQAEPTMLQTETRRIVRLLAITGLVACCVVVVAFALTRGGSADAWKQGLPRRHRDGDGHPARGVPGRAHHLPRARRVAIVAQPRAHAADAGGRDAGRRHRALRRQDGHPHAEPDDAAQARHRRQRHGPRRSRRWNAAGGAASVSSSTRSWRASATPSIRWSARSTRRATASSRTRSICIQAGLWCASTR